MYDTDILSVFMKVQDAQWAGLQCFLEVKLKNSNPFSCAGTGN